MNLPNIAPLSNLSGGATPAKISDKTIYNEAQTQQHEGTSSHVIVPLNYLLFRKELCFSALNTNLAF